MIASLVRKEALQRTAIWKGVRLAKEFAQISLRGTRVNFLGRIFPVLPQSLNLFVNDICNSHCQMCSVWKQKRDKEFTPKELSKILQDPLFRRLRHIGISGGEPTLREDLPEIYRVLADKQPYLRSAGIITNAIDKEHVIEQIKASADVCHKADLPFNVMVSLDGVDEIHDRVRGIRGNFSSAIEVIRYLRDHTDIPVSIGCTITKGNVWHVDDVLDLCYREGIYGRFRVAEFIDRLYNRRQSQYIRCFNDREAYHLGIFFAKLQFTYEKSSIVRNTYQSIRRMLMENVGRSAGCRYQSSAVALDCRGQLLYCSPHSPSLGSCLEQSAYKLYFANIEKRKKIIKKFCDNCIHDYIGDETLSEWWSSKSEYIWRKKLSFGTALKKARRFSIKRFDSKMNETASRILIVGWYGTETAGDKAILAEIIRRIQEEYPESSITLASLYPFYSRQTVTELGCPDLKVISTYSGEFWQQTKSADEIVMAGGPLMHISALGIVLHAFMRAKRTGHRAKVLGCGLGPLDGSQEYEEAVRYILCLADSIELRDAASVLWATDLTGRGDIRNQGDPSIHYVKLWKAKHKVTERGPTLNLYLRDWPRQYQGPLSDRQYWETKTVFENQLGRLVKDICLGLKIRPRLLPMHYFPIGKDDRDFNRKFASTYLIGLQPDVERSPMTVEEILDSMAKATFCLCMRFHSVVFANTLSVPFIAIDYTNEGKISAYLNENGQADRMISLKDVAEGKWRDMIDRLTSYRKEHFE